MADRIEQEIEEILAKIDRMPGDDEPGRKPIPITAKRKRKKDRAASTGRPVSSASERLNPTTLLFTGAGVMIAGLLLAGFWPPLIWASFAGVVLFLGAFIWSLVRNPRPANVQSSGGHFWRDRYIEYQPPSAGPVDRLKRRFRKR